jgi:hypothetical protein
MHELSEMRAEHTSGFGVWTSNWERGRGGSGWYRWCLLRDHDNCEGTVV